MQQIKKLTLLLLFYISYSLQAQEVQLDLSGKVLSDTPEYVYLSRFDNKIFTIIDSVPVNDGYFSFRTSLLLPDLYGLSIDKASSPYYIFLEEGSITVDFDTQDHYRNTKVRGSKSQQVFEEYRSLKDPDITEFIKKYPDQISSTYILYREWSYRLEPEELENLISLFSKEQQQSRFVLSLKEIIDISRQVAIGKKAPNVVANDADGHPIALYDQLQKYTLIEFWASWCPPCRLENPNLVANYHKYKDLGFGIYAISLDKNRDSWLKAIEDDGLEWTHVSELKYWTSSIVDSYAVRAIPANFLVDDQGIIVAKNLKGKELSDVLERLFRTQSK